MIRFDFDWSEPVNRGILAVLCLVWGFQIWFLFFKNRHKRYTNYDRIHAILHLALLITISLMILHPIVVRKMEIKSAILTGADVPDTVKTNFQHNKKADFISLKAFPTTRLDTLFIIGQDFDSSLFEKISASEFHPKVLSWIPYVEKDVVHAITWDAVIRRGEMLQVQGKISATKPQNLILKEGLLALDSLVLKEGENDFSLQTIAQAEGRNRLELWLGDTCLDTLHFYARPMPNLTFQFLLGHPDFESRTLADWLSKQGNAVLYQTKLTKALESSTNINRADVVDFIISDETGITEPGLKKHIESGKSVLFYNFSNPAQSLRELNRRLGTGFEIVENSKSAKAEVAENALPSDLFLKKNASQILLLNEKIAFEKFPGKVGVSLMNETYPLMLSGDSLQYRQFWNTLIAHLRPALKQNVHLKAPIFQGLNSDIRLNGSEMHAPLLTIQEDTLYWGQSAIHEQQRRGEYRYLKQGWNEVGIHELDEEIEVFVEPRTSWQVSEKLKRIQTFSSQFQTLNDVSLSWMGTDHENANVIISTWVWFAFILLLLTGIWIIEKLAKTRLK